MNKSPWFLVCCISFVIILPTLSQAATKALLLNPTRVVFVDRYRSTKITVGNSYDFSMQYEISLMTMRRGQDGRLYEPEVESAEERFVKEMIRFSPRRAVIEAKTRQLVKLMVRKPKNLPKGEYQTRLKITPLGEKNKEEIPAPSDGQGKPKIQLDVIVSVSIPLIIQHGDVHARVKPLELSLLEDQQLPSGLTAAVKLGRSGDCSAFGDVVLYHAPPGKKGKGKEIGRSKEIAVYLQEDSKDVTIPLVSDNQKELASGTIRVEFQSVIPGQKRVSIRNREVTFKDFPL